MVETTYTYEEAMRMHREMLEATIKSMYKAVEPVAKTEPAVKECVETIAAEAKKKSHREKVETEFCAAADALREAKLLDEKNRWVGGCEPKLKDLSPEQQDLKRAIRRFKSAKTEVDKLPVAEEDMHLTKRALRKLMRSPVDMDIKLLVMLAAGPVVLALDLMQSATPEILKNNLSMDPSAKLKAQKEKNDQSEELETEANEIETATDKKIVAAEIAEEAIEEEIYSAVVTPKELEKAIAAAREESRVGAVSKSASI